MAREHDEDLRAEEDARRARREFAKVKKIIPTLTALYLISAVGSAVLLVLFSYAAVAVDVPLYLTVLAFASLTVNLAAALRVRKKPYTWAVMGAVVTSLLVVSDIFGRDGSFVIDLFWAACFWAAVGYAARYEKVLARYPELAKGRIARARPERARQGTRRGRKASRSGVPEGVIFAGALLAGILLGFLFHSTSVKSKSPNYLAARIREEWAAGDLDALASHVASERRDAFLRKLKKGLTRRGWLNRRPALNEGVVDLHGLPEGRLAIAFPIRNEEPLVTSWRLEGTKWTLRDMALPSVQVKVPLDGVVGQFIAAWNGGDAADIASLSPPDKVDRQAKSLRRIFSRRGWEQRRPSVERPRILAPRDGRATVVFDLADGSLTTKWRFDGTAWRLSGIRFPKR